MPKGSPNPRWSNSKTEYHRANNVQASGSSDKAEVVLSQQQLQQLLKLIPNCNIAKPKGYDTEDELDNCFSGMVTCNFSPVDKNIWIIDSGASDHMTSHFDHLINVQPVKSNLLIKLPTGDPAAITHIGDVHLKNGSILQKVLYVPQFRHNLLSIHKLSKDDNCIVNFKPNVCEIVDPITRGVKAIGQLQNGLYYLEDKPLTLMFANTSRAITDLYTL